MRKFVTKVLFTTAMAVSFYGCGGDSDSSSSGRVVAVIEESKIDRCYDTYGVDADSGWSESISVDSYLEKMVCDKLTLYMRDMFSFNALCGSVEYNESKNRFDIEIVTEWDYKHIWADISGCRYKFASDGDLEGWIKTDPEWSFDECYCKTEDSVAYYRNADLSALGQSSSSQSAESSSSAKDASSSSAKSSSSRKEDSSSSESVLVTDEFVEIGNQEWMTRNLDIAVEGSRCYDDDPSNCEKYGRIYTWAQAMAIDLKYDREELGFLITPYRGICPEGSHLPTDGEWTELKEYIDENPEYKAYFTNQIGGAYDWKAFYRDEDVETVFWTATEYDATGSGYPFEYAWIWAYRKDGSIARSNPHKYMGAYVRCVKGDGLVMLLSSSSETESSSSIASSSSEEVDESSSSYEYPDLGRVEIGSQVWTTRNLEVPVKDSRCFGDVSSNCVEFGRLYTWSQAMGIDTKYDREQYGDIRLPYQGICPEGMHIPSKQEWETLVNYLQDNPEEKNNFTNQLGGEYEYYGNYVKMGEQGLFWSSTEYDVTGTSYKFEFAYLWAFRKDLSIGTDNAHKYTAANVRCIYNE